MSAYGITVTALAAGLAEAVTKDEAPEEGGFDLSAGMFGRSVSDWIRGVAKQLEQSPTTAFAGEGAGMSKETETKLPVGPPRLVRRALLLCSYCGADNPECSDDFPCDDCLHMDNIVEIDRDAIQPERILGSIDYLKDIRDGTYPPN